MLKEIKKKFGDGILSVSEGSNIPTVVVGRDILSDIVVFLKDAYHFNMLSDLTAADYPGRSERFEVVYHLFSLSENKRIRIKVMLREDGAELNSVAGIWKTADWLEREVFDMFGIKFLGHPDLTRLLMHDEFEGHPLRKDYPINKRQKILPPKEVKF